MIVSHEHRIMYLPIGQTGSKSVASWLHQHYGGEKLNRYHDWQIPPQLRDYFIFTVVRNPYEKMLSAYWFYCRGRAKRIPEFTLNMPLVAFLSAWLTKAQTDAPLPSGLRGFFRTQVDWAVDCQMLIPIERFDYSSHHLPFTGNRPPRIPHHGQSRGRPRDAYADVFAGQPEAEQLVWEIHKPDFERLGYHRHRRVRYPYDWTDERMHIS